MYIMKPTYVSILIRSSATTCRGAGNIAAKLISEIVEVKKQERELGL